MKAQFTTEDHRRFFAEFCRYEKASGGPDPQLRMVDAMANTDDTDIYERLWRAFCYIGVYNVPYGEIFWKHWSLTKVEDNPKELRKWLDNSFGAGIITTRIERRVVRRADWMDEYLQGAIRFIRRDWNKLYHDCENMDPYKAYEYAWVKVTNLPRIGRYSAIKLLEYLRRYCDLNIMTPDIRPKDAWSPRHTLGYIFPDRNLGNESNDAAALKMARQSCVDAVQLLKDEYDVNIDMFELQVLLCEYRESWESKKQYPGRSLDSELGYVHRAESEWHHKSDIWKARLDLFPHVHLGELNGWEKPRKPVGQCLSTHHYTWTDLLYDFMKTKDMAHPHQRLTRNDEDLRNISGTVPVS